MTDAALIEFLPDPTLLIFGAQTERSNLAAKQARNGFVFPGVGKLVVVKRKARMGRNPQTGEPIKIPAKTVVKFYVSKAVKDTIAPKR